MVYKFSRMAAVRQQNLEFQSLKLTINNLLSHVTNHADNSSTRAVDLERLLGKLIILSL